jgi:hypothetical protein
MTHASADARAAQRAPAWAPGVFLLGCAPVVADLLFGAIQLSTIVALVPAIATYGCAALLIRGFARGRGAGVGNGADLGRCLRGDRRVPDRADLAGAHDRATSKLGPGPRGELDLPDVGALARLVDAAAAYGSVTCSCSAAWPAAKTAR